MANGYSTSVFGGRVPREAVMAQRPVGTRSIMPVTVEKGSHMFFGQSVLGSDVNSAAPDPSVSRPVGAQAFVPRLVPVDARFPLTNAVTQRLAVTRVDPSRIPVGPAVASPPPGTLLPVDYSRQVANYSQRTMPITARAPRKLPIGRMRDPRPTLNPDEEQRYWNQWQRYYHPGVFHRPQLVGDRRYTEQHPGGPPTLGQFHGFGGLIGYGG